MNILLIHGPNLNMLGKRDPKLYGTMTQAELFEVIVDQFPKHEFTFYQSNYEGELIDVIQNSLSESYDGLIINPGALSHTSIALRDAIEILTIPKVEVHLSDVDSRESFRKLDYIADVVDKRFMGKKENSYIEAIKYLMSLK